MDAAATGGGGPGVDLERQTKRVGPVVQIAPLLREHEPEVRVVKAVPQFDHGLVLSMGNQLRDRLGRQVYRAARLGFRLPEYGRPPAFE